MRKLRLALAGLALLGNSADALEDAGFQALEFAVGDVEEVAGAAGGIEDAEVVQAVAGVRAGA